MNAIKSFRTEKKMSQLEFADGLGVNQTMVSQWELGIRNVSIKRSIQIEKKYGIPAEKICPAIKNIRRDLKRISK